MNVYHSIDEVPDTGEMNVTLTLGFFDGVHIGHKKVLDRLGEFHEPGTQVTGVVTFDRHPSEVFTPERALGLLTTQEEKLAFLGKFKISYVLVIPFDTHFASIPAWDFIEKILVGKLNVRHIVAGYDTRFGRGREGDVKMLEEAGKTSYFTVESILPVKFGDIAISSTAIRNSLLKGDVHSAQAMLGRPYTITGSVAKGERLGTKLGFPTANIAVPLRKIVPANGVYAAWCHTPDGIKKCAVNIGVRPTVAKQDAARTVEAHIMGFEGDLYNVAVTLEFERFIRPEKKFPDKAALVAQMKKDIAIADVALKA